MRSRLLLFLIVASLSVSGMAQTNRKKAQGLPPVVQRALDAFATLRFSGTRIVELKAGPDRVRHTEYVIKDGRRTRIEFPTNSPFRGQVIVESAKERRLYQPDQNTIRVTPPRRERLYSRLGHLRRPDTVIEVSDGGVLAGLRTQLVTVRDGARNATLRIWIEPKSGMLVKLEAYDRSGAVQGYFEYTQVNLSPTIRASDFNLNVKGAKIVTPRDDLRRLVKEHGYLDVSLPAKQYPLDSAKVQKLAGAETLIQEYTLGDRHLSLFQLRTPVDPSKFGRLPKRIRSITWHRGSTTFVLLGELSDEELARVSKVLGN